MPISLFFRHPAALQKVGALRFFGRSAVHSELGFFGKRLLFLGGVDLGHGSRWRKKTKMLEKKQKKSIFPK